MEPAPWAHASSGPLPSLLKVVLVHGFLRVNWSVMDPNVPLRKKLKVDETTDDSRHKEHLQSSCPSGPHDSLPLRTGQLITGTCERRQSGHMLAKTLLAPGQAHSRIAGVCVRQHHWVARWKALLLLCFVLFFLNVLNFFLFRVEIFLGN